MTTRLLLLAGLLAGCDLTVHAGGMGGGGTSGTGGGSVAAGGGSATGGGGAAGGGGGSLPSMTNNGETCSMPLAVMNLSYSGLDTMQATVTGDTTGHTDDTGNTLSSCGGTGAPDLFYALWANPGDKVSVTVTPTSGSFQPIVKIFGAVHGCNDADDRCNAASSAGGAATITDWTVSKTGSQVIAVDGDNGTSGTFTMLITVVQAPIDAGVDTGSCLSPADAGLPYSTPPGASTVGNSDVIAIGCGAPMNLPEAVYQLTLSSPTTVHLTGSDQSGQGIGVQVFQGACTGQSVGCVWKSNGVLDEMYSLSAGTWLFVIERSPAGSFSIQLQ